MMIDFFIFSWSEVLTSLRFVFVLVWILTVLFLTSVFVDASIRAFSYGRVLKHTIRSLTYKDYWPFAKHCYRHTRFSIASRWDSGSYWNGVGDWAYYDKKKGEWVRSKEGKDNE